MATVENQDAVMYQVWINYINTPEYRAYDSDYKKFKAGWHAAQQQTEWIAVEDRLPEAMERALVYLPGATTESEGIFVVAFRWPDDLPPHRGWSAAGPKGVTHWQPLPTPPKAVIEDGGCNV